jgi:hypothetical protein
LPSYTRKIICLRQTTPQVRGIKVLQLVDACGDADEDHSDDDRGEGGVGPHYAATISSRAIVLQAVELVKNGLSDKHVAEVMSLYRDISAVVRSTHKPMTRQIAVQYVRMVASSGLESLRCIMQASWSYAIAADASAKIRATASFAIRMRLASVDRKTTSLVNFTTCCPLSLARSLASPSTN